LLRLLRLRLLLLLLPRCLAWRVLTVVAAPAAAAAAAGNGGCPAAADDLLQGDVTPLLRPRSLLPVRAALQS
jgi:hypothetical protein